VLMGKTQHSVKASSTSTVSGVRLENKASSFCCRSPAKKSFEGELWEFTPDETMDW
jgi:hypothetical protein